MEIVSDRTGWTGSNLTHWRNLDPEAGSTMELWTKGLMV